MQPYSYLPPSAKEDYRLPAEQAIKAIVIWGWNLERGEEDSRGARTQLMKRRPSRGLQELPHGYMPRPVELNNLTLNREMQALAERLAENAHDIWALQTQAELTAAPERGLVPDFVPFDMLTDQEKKVVRERSQELLKLLIYSGYRFRKERQANAARNAAGRGSMNPPSEIESRFAYSLLEKLLHYCEVTFSKMRSVIASSTFTRRNSYKEASGDVKFFGKVCQPNSPVLDYGMYGTLSRYRLCCHWWSNISGRRGRTFYSHLELWSPAELPHQRKKRWWPSMIQSARFSFSTLLNFVFV